MANKFGFEQLFKGIEIAQKEFLHQGMKLAQEEFDSNFENQNDPGDEKKSGGSWEPIKYRTEPPPTLQLTLELRKATNSSKNVSYGKNFSILTIDPIDKKGKGYAEFHDTGTEKMPSRRTVVQSSSLDFKQLNLLKNLVDSIFNKQGFF